MRDPLPPAPDEKAQEPPRRWDREHSRLTEAEPSLYQESPKLSHSTRSAMTVPLTTVCVLSPALRPAAEEAARAVCAIRDLPDYDTLNGVRKTATAAAGRLIAAVAAPARRATVPSPHPPGRHAGRPVSAHDKHLLRPRGPAARGRGSRAQRVRATRAGRRTGGSAVPGQRDHPGLPPGTAFSAAEDFDQAGEAVPTVAGVDDPVGQ